MTVTAGEKNAAGQLRDSAGRKVYVSKTENAPPDPGDVQTSLGIVDADGREHIVILGVVGEQGPPGLNGTDGVPPGAINVKAAPYSAVGDGVTNDTAAIQAALDAVGVAGGGTIYFPEGNYLVSGALQTTGSYCTQLKLPLLGADRTIKITGERRANVFGDTPGPAGGVIITSTSTGAAYATNSKLPSVIGGPASTYPFTTTTNAGRVEINNIAIKVPANPRITGIDCGGFYQAQFDGVQVYSGGYPITTAATNKEGIGIVQPYLNNYDGNTLDAITIVGMYCGLVTTEHTGAPYVHIDSCLIGVSWWPMVYTAWFGNLDLERCKHGFAFNNFASAGGPANGDTTNPGKIVVDALDLEQQVGGAWNDYVSTVNDTARNALYLRILNVNQNVDDFITVASGAHVHATSLDAPSQQFTRAFRFNTDQSIPSATDTAISLTSNAAPVTPSIGSFSNGNNNLLAWKAANPTRLTAPFTGLYRIEAQAAFAHFAGSMATYLTLKSNGGTPRASASGSGTIITGSFETYLAVSATFEMVADDYIEMFCFQNSGGALNILKDVTWMTMTRIG